MTIKIKKFVDKGVYSPMGILQYGKTIEGRWIDLCFDPLEVAYYKVILWGWERVKIEFVK